MSLLVLFGGGAPPTIALGHGTLALAGQDVALRKYSKLALDHGVFAAVGQPLGLAKTVTVRASTTDGTILSFGTWAQARAGTNRSVDTAATENRIGCEEG